MEITKQENIRLKQTEFNMNYHVIRQDESDSGYTLIIIGWQALKEIFFDFIHKSNKNFIIFDYPGIGDNGFEPSNIDYTLIIRELILKLQFKFNIDKVIGTSAGTVFLINNIDIFPDTTKVLLLSPQISGSFIDGVFRILFSFFIWIKKHTGRSWYKKFINLPKVKKLWINTVSPNPKNKKTLTMVSLGMESSDDFWTPSHYLQMLKAKKQIKKNIVKVTSRPNTFFLIGSQDNLVDHKLIKKLIPKNKNKDMVKYFYSNHVLELEAIEELISFIY